MAIIRYSSNDINSDYNVPVINDNLLIPQFGNKDLSVVDTDSSTSSIWNSEWNVLFSDSYPQRGCEILYWIKCSINTEDILLQGYTHVMLRQDLFFPLVTQNGIADYAVMPLIEIVQSKVDNYHAYIKNGFLYIPVLVYSNQNYPLNMSFFINDGSFVYITLCKVDSQQGSPLISKFSNSCKLYLLVDPNLIDLNITTKNSFITFKQPFTPLFYDPLQLYPKLEYYSSEDYFEPLYVLVNGNQNLKKNVISFGQTNNAILKSWMYFYDDPLEYHQSKFLLEDGYNLQLGDIIYFRHRASGFIWPYYYYPHLKIKYCWSFSGSWQQIEGGYYQLLWENLLWYYNWIDQDKTYVIKAQTGSESFITSVGKFTIIRQYDEPGQYTGVYFTFGWGDDPEECPVPITDQNPIALRMWNAGPGGDIWVDFECIERVRAYYIYEYNDEQEGEQINGNNQI